MLNKIAAISGSVILAGCATTGGGVADSPPAAGAAKPPLPSRPAFVAADLAGKDAATLDALLGAPDLTRAEGAGEFRRYDLADCALVIILYPDERGAKRSVRLDAGALDTAAEKPDLDRCLARGRAS